DVVAEKIRRSFGTDGELFLMDLKREFGNAILIEPDTVNESEKVDDISLSGFSRGAITTFAAVRHLNDLGIPISLFAEDPVSGNSREVTSYQHTEFYKNHDLRAYTNLKHANVLVGAYKKNVNIVHNNYFRQMVPLF